MKQDAQQGLINAVAAVCERVYGQQIRDLEARLAKLEKEAKKK